MNVCVYMCVYVFYIRLSSLYMYVVCVLMCLCIRFDVLPLRFVYTPTPFRINICITVPKS